MDRYTKTVLSVIAAALVAIAVEQAASPAHAVVDCGGCRGPCWVYALQKALPGDEIAAPYTVRVMK
jgi:hypothetical protein